MTVNINSNIVAFHASCGDPNLLLLNLSPDVNRPSDDWIVNPGSEGITINGAAVPEAEFLFTKLIQCTNARLKAAYDGELQDMGGGTMGAPLDKITDGDFTLSLGTDTPLPPLNSDGNAKPVFHLESFKKIISGIPNLILVRRFSGDVVTVDLRTCAMVADGTLLKIVLDLIEFFMSRRSILMTCYVSGDGKPVRIEFETDE